MGSHRNTDKEAYPFGRKSKEIAGFHYTFAAEGNATLPPLLFIHNGGGDHRCWAYQLRELRDRFYCVALDLPGFGDSTRPDRDYTVEWLAARARDFIDATFAGRPIGIVGHCIGAAVALELARQESTAYSIERLTLVNLCAGAPGMSGPLRIFSQGVPKWRPLLDLAFRLFGPLLYGKSVQRSSLRQLFVDSDDATNLCIAYERDISARPEQTGSRKNLLLGLPSFAKYAAPFSRPNAKLPIQVIWGRRNEVMRPSLGEWLAGHLGTRVEWMEKSRHMPMSDEPKRFNELVAEFHRPSRASSA